MAIPFDPDRPEDLVNKIEARGQALEDLANSESWITVAISPDGTVSQHWHSDSTVHHYALQGVLQELPALLSPPGDSLDESGQEGP